MIECKDCIHHNVCKHDKNLVGNVFVMGNPKIFDNKELYRQFEDWKEAGFTCKDYLHSDMEKRKNGRWIYKKPPDDWFMSLYMCDQCHYWNEGQPNFCPNCGAYMRQQEAGE